MAEERCWNINILNHFRESNYDIQNHSEIYLEYKVII